MSASAICDGVIINLSAASVFGASMVQMTTYDVLNTASGSCAIVNPLGLVSEPDRFGSPRARADEWKFGVDIYVRHNNNPTTTKTNIIKAVDGVRKSLGSDDTLQDTCLQTTAITMRYEPTRSIVVSGIAWQEIRFTIAALDKD
jgi:hypothetical protein